jgi:hypothetical protein
MCTTTITRYTCECSSEQEKKCKDVRDGKECKKKYKETVEKSVACNLCKPKKVDLWAKT